MRTMFAALLVAASTSAEPVHLVRSSVAQVTAIVQSGDYAGPQHAARRRAAIRAVAEELFDFKQMGQRTLAQYWSELSHDEEEEFRQRFTDLLERSYVAVIERYAGERIVYTGHTTEGGYATVKSKVVTARGTQIPVEYRLYHTGQRWAVYDVVIEGVSLVSSYRSQFHRVIQSSSIDGFMQRLRRGQMEGISIPLPRVDR
jgi:phospholipid transport system substrate-binding protein